MEQEAGGVAPLTEPAPGGRAAGAEADAASGAAAAATAVAPPPPPAVGEPERPAAQPRQTLQRSLEAIRLGSLRLAAMLKARAAAVVPAVGGGAGAPVEAAADAQAPSAAAKLRARATELGAIARQASTRLVHSAAEGIRRLAAGGDPLLALCRSEPHMPQLVLASCTALVAGGGIAVPGIFKTPAPTGEEERLSASLAGGRIALIPPATNPHTLAALLKHFLCGLEEPLLTYRLLPDFVSAAGDLGQLDAVVAQLPAANGNVLRLLLEVCSYVNANSAATEMDSLALAQVLAPCVAWLPPTLKPQKSAPAPPLAAAGELAAEEAAAAAAAFASDSGAAHMMPLEGDEADAIVVVLEALIDGFQRG
ncbi:hypothetical protein Rsub_06168 [Raphidocelis subcapitata]|uniref:Rho-GAP domain-containing protein n=1 Tax=Raphidocelis subcapitata TaxID=307507 RepID=A0A2V0P2V7_9CHLO|nr:hypothetical protein Rsub_06168 [Raphidocelis subcapitata]|eukprot:GBF93919.1 hypothetical protein Rsub_06168 [Raphidocelis subcapitata]